METQDPHIKIFNKEYDKTMHDDKKNSCDETQNYGHRKYDHRQFGGGFLGPVVLFGGVLLLLTTLGLASKDVWQYIWPFWPVLLILAGIRIILGVNWIMSVLIALFTSVIFYGIAVYALIQVNSPVISRIYVPQGLVNFVGSLKK